MPPLVKVDLKLAGELRTQAVTLPSIANNRL